MGFIRVSIQKTEKVTLIKFKQVLLVSILLIHEFAYKKNRLIVKQDNSA